MDGQIPIRGRHSSRGPQGIRPTFQKVAGTVVDVPGTLRMLVAVGCGPMMTAARGSGT